MIKAVAYLYFGLVAAMVYIAATDPAHGLPWGAILMTPMFAYVIYEQNQQTKETDK